MLSKIRKWKDLIASFTQIQGNYTIMLVPHDGKSISRRDMDTAQMKKFASIVAGIAFGAAVTIILLSSMLYVSNKEARELAEYRKNKAQQEQRIQELAKNTEAVQKQLAALSKIEAQIREQMKKSGMELPSKEQLESSDGAKGGPSNVSISDIAILQQQNINLQKNLQLNTKNWDALLASIKNENYRMEVTPSKWPVDSGYVSSEFGGRANPFDGSGDYHPGIDIAENYGAPIYASASGYVQRAGWYGGYGNYVNISHDYGYATAYGHMSSISVSSGDYVEKGQVIGYVGSTGYSTGPHLHFEVLLNGEQVNPRKLIK